MRETEAMTDFLDQIGIGDPDDGPVRLTPTDAHANRAGSVHGGVLATLLDSAMGAAVRDGLDDGQDTATAALSVTYLEPAKLGEELTVEVEVLQRGDSIVMLTGTVNNPSGDAVAHGVATFAVIDDA